MERVYVLVTVINYLQKFWLGYLHPTIYMYILYVHYIQTHTIAILLTPVAIYNI